MTRKKKMSLPARMNQSTLTAAADELLSGQDEDDLRDQLYKIGLPGKSILGDYFQENMTFQRPFLFLRIDFPGRPIYIQLPPGTWTPCSRAS